MNNRHQTLLPQYSITIVLVIAYLTLGVVYSIVNPIHEATDEVRHYRYVRYIADLGQLPVQSAEQGNAQAHHPPLYYASAALTSFWFHTSNPLYEPEINPQWSFRNWEVGTDNKNLYIHGPDESWPYQDAALAAHLARWTTLIWGAGTVLLTVFIARMLFPERPWLTLAAGSLIAFNPMFLYLGAAVNNDVPAGLAGAAITYVSLRLIRSGYNHRFALILGAIYGLALLIKFNLLAMLAVIEVSLLLVFIISPRNQTDKGWIKLFQATGIIIGVALLISGWWYVRNILLYGEPTGFLTLTDIWGLRDPSTGVGLTIPELRYAWSTLWARFGYGQIPVPSSIYVISGILCSIGGIGLILSFVRGRRAESEQENSNQASWETACVLLTSVVVNFIVLYAYITVSPAGAMGRFFFPGLPAFVILVVQGWSVFLPIIGDIIPSLITSLGMTVLSILVLVAYLAPAYAHPDPVAPPEGEPSVVFGETARILDYQVHEDDVFPGQAVNVSITWEALKQTETPYYVALELRTVLGLQVVERLTYHGLGNYPTSIWEPGHIFTENYRIFLPDTAYAPLETVVTVALFSDSSGFITPSTSKLTVYEDRVFLAPVTILTRPTLDYPNQTFINWDGRFALVGYTVEPLILWQGQAVTVTTYWQALEPPQDEDFVIFLHVMRDWNVYAAQDGRPVFHDARTSDWVPGEIYVDERTLRLPGDIEPGAYLLELGWFSVNDLERLNIVAEDGHIIDNWLNLHTIEVQPNPYND